MRRRGRRRSAVDCVCVRWVFRGEAAHQCGAVDFLRERWAHRLRSDALFLSLRGADLLRLRTRARVAYVGGGARGRRSLLLLFAAARRYGGDGTCLPSC